MESIENDHEDDERADQCSWELGIVAEMDTQQDTIVEYNSTNVSRLAQDTVSDAIHVIQELFARYEDDPYRQTRTYNYVCYQLPNILENIQKDHEYRIQRMEELSNEQQQFINSFMSNNQYFYVHTVERFFHYDGIHYKILNEDDILYNIFSLIRRDRNLLCWKQRTKQHIMRKIKENNLLKSVPESETIQNVLDALYPTFFETKAEAKYFLCILGDNILKKNNHLIHFIDSQSKHFIRELNNICQTVIGVQLNATLKHKYYEHDYVNCRIVHIHETSRIDSVWIPILQTHALDLICVACHYSMRYNSSDEYLTTSCNDMDLVSRVFYLKNIQQEELVSLYVNEYLEVHRYRRPSGEMNELFTNANHYANDARISWKDMQYLWKQFLDSKKLPSIIFQHTLKGLLVQKLKDYYREQDDSFVGISCKHLPSVKKFILFWENTIEIDETGNNDDFEYEVNEILYLYKKWCGSSQVNKQFTEQQVLDIITYFYPEIEIDKKKYE
jgi:ribosomal 30S subunit maturation factor RimM